jgi:hypothetical protein
VKHWKTYLLTVALVCVFASKARADGLPSSTPAVKPLDLTLHTKWLQRDQPFSVARTETSSAGSVSRDLPSARLWNCDKEALSGNVWLMSRHQGKDRKKELQEENIGGGIVYSCDQWSAEIDRMINSNNGKATLVSLLWSTPDVELGPVLIRATVGYMWLSYEVPKYHATLYDNTGVAFVSVRLKEYPKFSVNGAPVPKTAGNAYIIWVTYELLRFE